MTNTYYKGLDKDFKCRGFKYEVGKTYKHKGKIGLCEQGFHACENPLDVFAYYNPADSRFAEVEAKGNIDKGDDKIVCSELKIKAEIGLNGLIGAGVKFILDKVDFKNAPATNTGYRSAATNTGNQSAATNTGNQSAATNTGNRSAATVEGKESIACGLGYSCKAKGAKGCWLVLAEREDFDKDYKIKCVKAVKVDGKKIKANTFYKLIDGEFKDEK